MKKVLLSLGLIIIVLFTCIFLLVKSNTQALKQLKDILKKETGINNIDYVNVYDNYYIVKNEYNLYVFDNKYKELINIDNILIHKNNNNYDIIYKDGKLLYLNDYLKNDKLYYEYYDLYSYELVNKIVIGG